MYILLMLFVTTTLLFIFLSCYFIPVIVAYIRGHKNIAAITIMTVFLGWTFLGWLAALLWSLNGDIKEEDEPKKQEESECSLPCSSDN